MTRPVDRLVTLLAKIRTELGDVRALAGAAGLTVEGPIQVAESLVDRIANEAKVAAYQIPSGTET